MVVTCPLCAYQFDSEAANICSSCPINHGCEKVCCPNCRYGWVESSSVVDFFSTIYKKGKKKFGRS